jgi:hypothetical protein
MDASTPAGYTIMALSVPNGDDCYVEYGIEGWP